MILLILHYNIRRSYLVLSLFKTYKQLTNGGYQLNGRIFKNNLETFSPLFEAKMIWHFDNRYGSFEGLNKRLKELPTPGELTYQNDSFISLPWYWVNNNEEYFSKYSIALRNVTDSRNERTLVSTVLCNANAGHTLIFLNSNTEKEATALTLLTANINSIILDYLARQKVGSTSIDLFRIKQLPIFALENIDVEFYNKIICLSIEMLGSNWGMKAIMDDVWKEADADLKAAITKQWGDNKEVTGGHEWAPPEWCEIDEAGCPLPPFKWDENRRAVLKAELDAIYAKLYGLTTEELRYILDPQDVYGPDFPGETFRVLKEKEIKKFGEYRTRRLVLEAWEKLNKNDNN